MKDTENKNEELSKCQRIEALFKAAEFWWGRYD
jgi:hypothetical protein